MSGTGRPAPGRQAEGSSDRRWIVLSEGGRFTDLGRARDPSDDEIRHVEDGLHAQGAAGWLAIMSGSAHADEIPTVIEIRPLAGPSRPFAEAADAFRKLVEDRRGS